MGVDLNTNFDAEWGAGKFNVFEPASANYVGKRPFDQAETIALRDFTRKIKPASTISYHALGRELYWEFGQIGAALERDRAAAEFINGILGYKMCGGDMSSAGGYKDWCISELKIPSFTIELVPEKYSHPLTDDKCIDGDFAVNKFLPVRLLQYLSADDL
jgi:g-D-glutamyl-meso-diaminopimelate peptidase